MNMKQESENEYTNFPKEHSVNINIHGTVNGNVTGANYGTMFASTANCCNKDTIHRIRPNIKESDKESHKLLKEAFDAQKTGDINVIISIIQKAIDTELHEKTPDLNTVAFSKYMLIHYLLTDSRNDKNVIPVIDEILQTKDLEKDIPFYCNVLLKKAHALFLTGEVKKARAVINIVDKKIDDDNKNKSDYLMVVGQLALYEGNIDDAISLLTKGKENALSDHVVSISEEDKFSSYQHYFAFLTCIGEVYRAIHRPDLARNLWQNAVDAANNINWSQEKVRPLFGYVECLIQYEEYTDADKHLEDIYNIVLESDNMDLLKQYYHLKATIKIQQNHDGWHEAIECFKKILELSISSNEKIDILRIIADIQARHGDANSALQHLEKAKKIETNDILKKHDSIERQANDIKESLYYVDGKVRYLPSAPTKGELQLIEGKCNQCENAILRLKMLLDLGIGYIDVNSDCAYEWLSKAYENASKMKDNLVAAQALIGQACILFEKQNYKSEEWAEKLIDLAIDITKNIPMWEIRARAKMFKGMAIAHKENFKDAYNLFLEAQHIVESHKISDQLLCDYISDYVDECKYILSKTTFSDIDFDNIFDEIKFMENWYPKYKKDLLHFLWYNRHEDIEKLVISSPKSKAFLISDDQNDILEWCNSLNALFDIFCFSSETDYHTESNWNFSKFIPVPKNMKSQFFNTFIVLHNNGG